MKHAVLLPLALLSLSVQAAQVTAFNKECLDNEATIVAVRAHQPLIQGEVCDRGQLSAEDLSYVESVQPANAVRAPGRHDAVVALAPSARPIELEGEVCDRGQLTAEDLSYVESVQPGNAVRKGVGHR